jgi:hypothetical protein
MISHRAKQSEATNTGPGLVFVGLGLFAMFFLAAAFIFIICLAGAFIFSIALGEE